jgi:DNA-directed RNA polymerase specialized sigma subunit
MPAELQEPSPDGEGDNTLEGAARDSREYVRERLLEELGREPSEEEVSEWLREHTESY